MNLDYSQDFPYKERIYLNNASTSRMPRSSIVAMNDFLVKYNELGPDSEASDNYVRERLGNLRKEISGLIKCKPEEVVLTQSVTDGINFVANGLKPEDCITTQFFLQYFFLPFSNTGPPKHDPVSFLHTNVGLRICFVG